MSTDDQFRLLHLSDLHFGTMNDAENWFDQLAADLKHGLDCKRLGALILSGDIANHSTEEEYQAAGHFIKRICDEFSLELSQTVIVPGNHDLNWKISKKKGYAFNYREDYDGELCPGHFIELKDDMLLVRAAEKQYNKRFTHFSRFYEAIKGEPYPDQFAEQATLDFFEKPDLVVLGLNSAWQIDHHFKDRADICTEALSVALQNIRNDPVFSQSRKIAVWHHALPDFRTDQNDNTAFMQRLAQEGFSAALHGHIHKADNHLFRFNYRKGDGNIEVIGAGTFGAPIREWVPGYPLQYCLLILQEKQLTVKTRCRREQNGAWAPHAIWPQGAGQDPSSGFTIQLPCPSAKIKKNDGDKSDQAPVKPSSPLRIPPGYKTWIKKICGRMDIRRLRGKTNVISVKLPEVFITLQADPPKKETEKLPHGDMTHLGKVHARDIEDLAIENQHLVIQGQAGSGKTTLIKHIAYSIVVQKRRKAFDGFLPVLIFLRELGDIQPDNKNQRADAAFFKRILAHYFDKKPGNRLNSDTILNYCRADKALFLLDGLDEINANLRDWLAESVEDFLIDYPGCKIILSGRPHGVKGAVVDCFGDWQIKINPLNQEQIENFVNRWFCYIQEEAPGVCTKAANDMLAEMKAHPYINELNDTPLMLTAICLLFYDGNELPGQRAELYQKFIEYLLHRRFDHPARIFQFLMRLAHTIQMKQIFTIDRDPAVALLQATFESRQTKAAHPPEYWDTFFDQAEEKCGLLKYSDNNQYSFWHKTFQEYLAAVALVDREQKSLADAILVHWDTDFHKEMIQLYIGHLSAQKNTGMAHGILNQVLEQTDRPPFKRWRLAAQALLTINKEWRNPGTEAKTAAKLIEIMQNRATPAPDRAEAGEILGWLSDQRDNFKRFIAVSPGLYPLSNGKKQIDAFEIAKYPVTNSQFKEFVDAQGYDKESCWSEQGLRWLKANQVQAPRYWYDRKWNCPNAPVVGICWYEADAFCRWLTKNDSDYQYFLPDENQWEAAAAGFDKRKYPWGPEWQENYCNSDESGIKKTSAVGLFEEGDTPEGISDMAGNVWEWTSSDYHSEQRFSDFDYDPVMQKLWDAYAKSSGEEKDKLAGQLRKKLEEKDRTLPVLRGGGWDFNRDYMRCAVRLRYYPDLSDIIVGFRCSRTKN